MRKILTTVAALCAVAVYPGSSLADGNGALIGGAASGEHRETARCQSTTVHDKDAAGNPPTVHQDDCL